MVFTVGKLFDPKLKPWMIFDKQVMREEDWGGLGTLRKNNENPILSSLVQKKVGQAKFPTCGYHSICIIRSISRKQMMMNHFWGPRPASSASKAPATIIFLPVPSKLTESSINNPATSLSSEEGRWVIFQTLVYLHLNFDPLLQAIRGRMEAIKRPGMHSIVMK